MLTELSRYAAPFGQFRPALSTTIMPFIHERRVPVTLENDRNRDASFAMGWSQAPVPSSWPAGSAP